MAEDRENDDERQAEAGVFDFESGVEIQADEPDNSDIFATLTDGDNQDDGTGRVNERSGEACQVSSTAVTKPVQSRAVKKVRQLKDEAQIGFLW